MLLLGTGAESDHQEGGFFPRSSRLLVLPPAVGQSFPRLLPCPMNTSPPPAACTHACVSVQTSGDITSYLLGAQRISELVLGKNSAQTPQTMRLSPKVSLSLGRNCQWLPRLKMTQRPGLEDGGQDYCSCPCPASDAVLPWLLPAQEGTGTLYASTQALPSLCSYFPGSQYLNQTFGMVAILRTFSAKIKNTGEEKLQLQCPGNYCAAFTIALPAYQALCSCVRHQAPAWGTRCPPDAMTKVQADVIKHPH